MGKQSQSVPEIRAVRLGGVVLGLARRVARSNEQLVTAAAGFACSCSSGVASGCF